MLILFLMKTVLQKSNLNVCESGPYITLLWSYFQGVIECYERPFPP